MTWWPSFVCKGLWTPIDERVSLDFSLGNDPEDLEKKTCLGEWLSFAFSAELFSRVCSHVSKPTDDKVHFYGSVD